MLSYTVSGIGECIDPTMAIAGISTYPWSMCSDNRLIICPCPVNPDYPSAYCRRAYWARRYVCGSLVYRVPMFYSP